MALEENRLTGLGEEFDFIFKVLGSQVFSLQTRLGVSIPAKKEPVFSRNRLPYKSFNTLCSVLGTWMNEQS